MLKIVNCYGFIPRYMLDISIHSSSKIPAWFFRCHNFQQGFSFVEFMLLKLYHRLFNMAYRKLMFAIFFRNSQWLFKISSIN